MKYNDLLIAQKNSLITKEALIKRYEVDKVLENVVIAPFWPHTMFATQKVKIEKVGKNIYNIYGDDFSLSFIELKSIGAPYTMEYALSLGITKCQNVIFVGSASSLNSDINIGDICTPTCSICGEGASRYLNKNLEDEFGKSEYPNRDFYNKLKQIIIENKKYANYHEVKNISIDTIFAQYNHLSYFNNLNIDTLEMECAAFFKACELINLNYAAIFCISDSTIKGKTLYNNRTSKDREYRHKVRDEIITDIIIKTFKNK